MTVRVALVLLAFAAPAFGQQGGAGSAPSIGQYLAKMDRNGDGVVSLAEYQDWLSYAFDAMDRDGDGVLSAVEQPGGRGKPLTRMEYRERIAERFRRQDGNRDNVLGAKELASPPQ